MTSTRPTALLLFPIILWLAGCGSTSEERRAEPEDDTEAIRRTETSFNPADYDPEIPSSHVPAQPGRPSRDTNQPSTPTTEPDLVSGYRVQVTFTDNIEQASQVKNQLSPLFTGENVYVVYEAPYYKVRVGDFLSRPDANLTLRSLFEKGYKDSWIVPDKVRKEPD